MDQEAKVVQLARRGPADDIAVGSLAGDCVRQLRVAGWLAWESRERERDGAAARARIPSTRQYAESPICVDGLFIAIDRTDGRAQWSTA
jgi:hypothetical protein